VISVVISAIRPIATQTAMDVKSVFGGSTTGIGVVEIAIGLSVGVAVEVGVGVVAVGVGVALTVVLGLGVEPGLGVGQPQVRELGQSGFRQYPEVSPFAM